MRSTENKKRSTRQTHRGLLLFSAWGLLLGGCAAQENDLLTSAELGNSLKSDAKVAKVVKSLEDAGCAVNFVDSDESLQADPESGFSGAYLINDIECSNAQHRGSLVVALGPEGNALAAVGISGHITPIGEYARLEQVVGATVDVDGNFATHEGMEAIETAWSQIVGTAYLSASTSARIVTDFDSTASHNSSDVVSVNNGDGNGEEDICNSCMGHSATQRFIKAELRRAQRVNCALQIVRAIEPTELLNALQCLSQIEPLQLPSSNGEIDALDQELCENGFFGQEGYHSGSCPQPHCGYANDSNPDGIECDRARLHSLNTSTNPNVQDADFCVSKEHTCSVTDNNLWICVQDAGQDDPCED